MQIESRLVPILRDGVEVIKMILYMKLRKILAERHPQENQENTQTTLCSCVINELFGTINNQEPFYSFIVENQTSIENELKNLASNLPEMMIPVTDALRIQTICDFQEGTDNHHILQKARDLGVLLTDRDMPMPHTFIALVRKMGITFGLVSPNPNPTLRKAAPSPHQRP